MTERSFYFPNPPPSYSKATAPEWNISSTGAMSQQYQHPAAHDDQYPPTSQQYPSQQLPQQSYPGPLGSFHTAGYPPLFSQQQQQQRFPSPHQTEYRQSLPQQPLQHYSRPQVQQYSPSQQYPQPQSPRPLPPPVPGQEHRFPPPQQHILQQVIIQDKNGSPHGAHGHSQPRRMETGHGRLFNSLGRAVDFMAKKAKNNISRDVSNTFLNPLELLKPGYVVQLISKLTGKSLRVLENGLLDCTVGKGTACEYIVAGSGGRNSALKFQNVAQPHYYLAIVNGFTVGYGLGGADCDFIPMMTSDYHVTLESAVHPGSHIGVLPSGQLTDPAQTNKMTDAAHFKVKYLRNT